MNWSFIVDYKYKRINDLKDIVKKKAKSAVDSLGMPNEDSLFKVNVVFYQKYSRYREITDLDNLDGLLKHIFDSLDSIIGYRSRYVEVHAKKLVSSSEKDFISVEIEEIKK